MRLRGFAMGCTMRVKRQDDVVRKKKAAMEKALRAFELEKGKLEAERRLEEAAMLAYSDGDEEFAAIVERIIG